MNKSAYKSIGHHEPHSGVSLAAFLGRGWHSVWNIIKYVARGGLRLKWVKQDEHPADSPLLVHQNPPPPVASASGPLSALSPSPLLSPGQLKPADKTEAQVSLMVYCLGTFRVYQNNQPIKKWCGNKAKSIFKYLVVHRGQPIHREALMELLWPDVEPESARRNLYQAIYSLRKTLQTDDPEFSHILFEDNQYRLNPEMKLWVDSEAFQAAYKAGQQLEQAGQLPEAISEYQVAESLYQGKFLAEDIYEDWPTIQREHLKLAHLDILNRLSQHYFEQGEIMMSITFCQKLLAEDDCREDAHRRLMRCYLHQGQRHLALRQYHLCVEALDQELDVPPMPATTELYRQIQEDPSQL